MKEQSPDNQELYRDIEEEDIAAKLIIYVDNDGNIMYNCDWEPGEEGIIGIASIFYKLLADNLSDQIFEEIKAKCVLGNAEEDIIAIHDLINSYASKQQEADMVADDIVVPPDRVTNI